MTWQIEKDESNASRRVIEFRTFKSDGTSPDTGSSGSSLRMSIGGNVQFTPDVLVSAISANAGMYFFVPTQSNVSVLGNHALWYEGAFPQHVATVQVVGYNPMSRTSAFTSADSVGLKAVTHSAATIAGILDYSLLSGVKSNFSIRLDTNAIPAGAFQADSIDATAMAAMNLSDVTVRVHPMAYSGLTVEVNNLAGAFSAATVQVSGGTIAGVTNMVQSNVSQIRGRQILADILASHISSVVTGVAVAGVLSVTTMTSDVAEATNDHFNGRVIIFTTGALLGQATSINTTGGFVGASNGSSRFAFPALTEAPTAGDSFVIV